MDVTPLFPVSPKGFSKAIGSLRMLGIAASMLCVLSMHEARATSAGVDPYFDYRKRTDASAQVGALSDSLFGDQISLYDGSTSFVVTDIDIPGNNALPVSLSRRLAIENEPETRFPYDPRLRGLGNWDIEVPYMTATLGADTGWSTQPCTYGGGIPGISAGSGGKFHRWEIWQGVTINVPGRGQTRMLGLETGVPRPSVGEFGATTSERDAFECIPMKSGFAGSGVRMTTASGLRYYLDVGVVRKASSLLTHIWVPGPGSSYYTSPPTGGSYSYFDLFDDPLRPRTEPGLERFPTFNSNFSFHSPADYASNFSVIDAGSDIQSRELIYLRNQYYALASRIEDRFGNWVQYEYNSNGHPTRIWSSDGREILLSYTGSRLTTAVAGERSWTFSYQDPGNGYHELTQVVLPDSSRWAYAYSGTLRPSTLGDDTIPALPECRGEPLGFDNAYQVLATHPGGAQGSFSFSYQRHYRSGVHATECVQTSFDPRYDTHPNYRLDVPHFFDVMSLTSKVLSGPGIPQPSTWQYEYAPAGFYTMLWGSRTQAPQYPCTTCTPSKWVTVTNPDGTKTRERFGILYRVNDGRRLESQTLDTAGNVMQSQTFQYMTDAEAAQQPFHGVYGRLLGGLGDPNSVKVRPVKRETTLYSGMTFFREHLSFDVLARPASTIGGNGVNSRSESFTYHDDTILWVLSQPASTTSINTGQVLSKVEYNAQALPERVHGFGLKLKYTLSHWPDGQLKTITDGRGNTTWLGDYHRGVPRLIGHPATPESPAGATESATVDGNGWITSVVDETGAKTCYTHDPMGRTSSVTSPSEAQAGVCDNSTWKVQFSSFAPIPATDWVPPGVSHGQWRHTVAHGDYRKFTYYDAMWRPVLIHEYDAINLNGTLRSTSMAYDENGRVKFQSYPSSATVPAAMGTRTFYDALGRVTRVEQDAENSAVLATTTQYLDGLQTRVTNPKGNQTVTSFMAWDIPTYDYPIASVQPEDKVVEIARHPQFGWPLQLRQRNAADTLSVARQYVYDVHGQLCKTIEPETGATVMDYDAAGNLSWSATGLTGGSYASVGSCSQAEAGGSGRMVHRGYDPRNRLTNLAFPDGRGNQEWTYTADGLPATVTAYNTHVSDSSGTRVITAYTYNNRRLLTGESITQPNWYTWTTGYAYNGLGHLSHQTYPTGLMVDYAPNALGQATKAGAYASGAQYYPNGAIKQFTYGNGIVHAMYQNARQLPSRSTSSGGTLDLGYFYDNNGNVSHIADHGRGEQFSRWMQYDALDRLTDVGSVHFGGDHWHRFTYDALDNLKSWKLAGVKDYADYIYDVNNRLTNIRNTAGATVVGLSYGPQGNLQNKNGQVHVFDYGNRLRDVVGKESYRYDGLGRRVTTWKNNGGAELWQYTQAGQMVFSSDWEGSGYLNHKTHEHVYLAGSLVASIDHDWPSNALIAVKYQHTDALGSPVAVTNASGQVIERMDYEPWGAIIGKPGHNGIGYTGHVMDGATGLTYMQQRYYDQSVGRFLSVDPVVASSSTGANFNRYKYAANNPYRFVDPDGLLDRERKDHARETSNAKKEAAKRYFQDYVEGQGAVEPVYPEVVIPVFRVLRTFASVMNELGKHKPHPKPDNTTNGPGADVNPNLSGSGNVPVIYGPFHRVESPTQTPEVARLIIESGRLFGQGQRQVGGGRGIPVVQAYNGPLPAGVRGIEFMTPIRPAAGSRPGAVNWYRNNEGVDDVDIDWVSIPVNVTKTTQ